MDLIKLQIKNFMSYQSESLDFEKREGLFGVIGRNSPDVDEDDGNAAGKTNLFNTVPFAFYGRVRGDLDCELVNEDYIYIDENNEKKDKAEVEVIFSHMGKYHKVIRTISDKGNQTLQFYGSPTYDGDKTKWNCLTLKAGVNKRTGKRENGIVRTQQRIADVLGCSADLFINSVYFEQSNTDTFARGTLSEKDNVIKSAAGVERWDDYGIMMSAELKEAEKEMSKYDTLLGEEGSVEDIEGEITKQKDLLQARTHEIDAQKSELKKKKTEFDKHTIDVVKAEERIKIYDDLVKQRADVESILREINSNCAKVESEYIFSKEQIQISEEKIVKGNEIVKLLAAEKKKLTEKIIGHKPDDLSSPRLSEIGPRQGELTMLLNTLKQRVSQHDLIKSKYDDLTSKIKGRTDVELVKLKDQIKVCTETIGGLEGQLQDIVKKGKSVDGSVCAFNSLCGFTPTDAEKEKIKFELRGEYSKIKIQQNNEAKNKASYEAEIKDVELDLSNQSELRKFTLELDEIKKAQSDIEIHKKDLDALNKEIEEISANFSKVREDLQRQDDLRKKEAEFDMKQREVTDLSKDHARFMKERDSLASRLDLLKKEAARYEEQYSQISDRLKAPQHDISGIKEKQLALGNEIDEINSKIESVNGIIQEIKSYLKTLEKSAEKVNSHKAQLKDLQDRIEVMKYSLDMVRKHIPHLLVSAMVPEVRDHMRNFIYRISNGRMDCDIRMDRDLKNDTKTHAFDIWIYKDGKTFKYAQTCGGERARADISIHLAYICLIASRNNSRFETLFLDEVGAALDRAGVRRFVEIIKEVMTEYGFKKVFNITQNRDMMKMIDNRMLVTMTSEGSKVTM